MLQPNSSDAGKPRFEGRTFDELFAQYHKAFLGTAYRILRSKEDSEDAVQTAYLRAIRAIHTLRSEMNLRPWIAQIVVNCCLEQIRARRARNEVGIEDVQRILPPRESQQATPETICRLNELKAAHASAVSGLPQILHDVYVPCAMLGSNLAEVSQRLGLTVAAGKTRLHRARTTVKHSLQFAAQRRVA